MSRRQLIQQYLFSLVERYERLEAERLALLEAATRITAIQDEKAILIADAQDALTKYNSVFGTTYTLQDIRAWYDASVGNIRTPVEPPPETP